MVRNHFTKGYKMASFYPETQLLIAKHGLNKPGHGTMRERWLFSPDASNITAKMNLPLADTTSE